MHKMHLTIEDLSGFVEECIVDERLRNYLYFLIAEKKEFSRKEEAALLQRIREDDEKAAEAFALGHMWISALMALHFTGRGLSYYHVLTLADDALGNAMSRYWKGEGEYPCRDFVLDPMWDQLEQNVSIEAAQATRTPRRNRKRFQPLD